MSDKPKFAMYWAASCGGCEIAVLNIHEKILDVDANFDVVFWPVAMDAKYKDVEAMPDKSILLTLFNGELSDLPRDVVGGVADLALGGVAAVFGAANLVAGARDLSVGFIEAVDGEGQVVLCLEQLDLHVVGQVLEHLAGHAPQPTAAPQHHQGHHQHVFH